ncbi:hypothetical protein GFO_1301 [Christiangramia forsetii KT0803]|uniref:Uncharacterized protein n=1 Tax=Christiangramia forsetii (strain DSM 17595 / CGMCC 1.15422 / KT0803) TaxID=411154 RepID=A0M0Y0_CHRFK|nr:hypothetical protein GFO_1301 [Christiangramia forsetii KT0803]
MKSRNKGKKSANSGTFKRAGFRAGSKEKGGKWSISDLLSLIFIFIVVLGIILYIYQHLTLLF